MSITGKLRTVFYTRLAQKPIQPFVEEGKIPFVALFCGNIHIADPRDRSHKDPVTLVEVKVLVREENSTSILSGQGDDIMMEHIERETLSEVPLEVQLEEVVSALEEIPSMVELNARQLRKLVLLISRAERIVEGGRREDGTGANDTGDELVVLAGGEVQEGGVESRQWHEVVGNERGEGMGF